MDDGAARIRAGADVKRSLEAETVAVLRTIKRRTIGTVRSISERVVTRGMFPWLLDYPKSDGSGGRSRPHVLITRYHYHAKDASMGESTEELFLDNSLTATGAATYDTFFWETDYSGFPSGDRALLEKCRTARPDVVLLSSYEAGHPSMPSLETIRMIRRTWGIPIIAFWYDTCWDGFWASIEPLLDYVDLHLTPDNPEMTFVNAANSALCRDRFLSPALPWDLRVYNDPGRVRDLDVSFLGQVGGYRSARMPYIEHLMEQNMAVYWSGFDRAQQPPFSKYLEVLTRSKMALNFSHSVNHHQFKGRVHEIMLCGALMLETRNPQTPHHFTPMKDYVTFDSKEDLVEKIRYFLAHDDQRAEIAARGRERARRDCDNAAFWDHVFGGLEKRTGKRLRPAIGAAELSRPEAPGYNISG
jgi:hypothetical protein